jgi:hypothetical protein
MNHTNDEETIDYIRLLLSKQTQANKHKQTNTSKQTQANKHKQTNTNILEQIIIYSSLIQIV